jgi:PmbA protein
MRTSSSIGIGAVCNWYHSQNSYRGVPARRPSNQDPAIVSGSSFTHPFPTLQQIARDVLDHARTRGASNAEVEVSEGFGQSVTVRRDEVETIEYNRDKGVGVSVYIGKQRGHASTSDFSPQALRDAVDAALSIARLTASDEYSGLADADLLAREFPDLDLFHAWPIDVEQAIELARDCEAAAFGADSRVTNSEGASVSVQQSHFVYGNSAGFLGGYPSSRHSIACAVIAGKDDAMQRDDWYATARAPGDLQPAADVGATAGRRAARRVGARKMPTMRVPVLFEAPVASSLLGHFVSAVSGGSLYRKSSFLLDSLGKPVFAPHIRIRDLPHLPRGLASAAFDDEGVATRTRDVVDAGVLKGYFLGSYSARKLGLRSTGNAGGNHNLILESTGEDFAALLKKMGRGLLVTELLGQGVNMVTGDYSRGAAGFWVENGEIAHPVNEVTVAGNLADMFMHIVAVGSDRVARGSRQTGSILVEGMTVAGE